MTAHTDEIKVKIYIKKDGLMSESNTRYSTTAKATEINHHNH